MKNGILLDNRVKFCDLLPGRTYYCHGVYQMKINTPAGVFSAQLDNGAHDIDVGDETWVEPAELKYVRDLPQ